jgi:hypothetical protein
MTSPRLAFFVICAVITALLVVVSAVIVAEDGAEPTARLVSAAATSTTLPGVTSSTTTSIVPPASGAVPSVTATVPPVTPPPVVATLTPAPPTNPATTTTVARTFATVLRVTGTGDQKSPTMTLTGASARVQYESTGPLTVYLLPASQTGGHTATDQPLAQCASSCPVPTVKGFNDQPGSYYLDIVGSAGTVPSSWSVEIDELR